jgi:hypothetical protein
MITSRAHRAAVHAADHLNHKQKHIVHAMKHRKHTLKHFVSAAILAATPTAALAQNAPAPMSVAPAPTVTTPAAPITPGAPTPNVEGIGTAPIANGDRVRARDRAFDDAFRQAIDQAAAALLGSGGVAARTSQLKLSIEPKAKSYATSYRVLEEGEQNGTFRVHIAAVLDLERLERDLQAPSKGAHPAAPRAASAARAIVCIAERDDTAARAAGAPGTSAAPTPWVPAPYANVVAAAVGTNGVEVAPMPSGCLPDSPVAVETRAAEAAKSGGAQGAVVGSVVVEPAGPIRGTSLVGAHATVELRLVDENGRVDASARAEHDGWGEPGAASASASRPALDEALATLAPAIARKWPRDAGGVLVRVDGVTSWADLQLFQRGAGALPGVTSVEPRRFSIEGAELLVRGDVTAPALSAAIARGPDAARFHAISHGDRALDVEILPPPPPPPAPMPPAAAPAPNGAGATPLPTLPPGMPR